MFGKNENERGVFMGRTKACEVNGDKETIIGPWMFCMVGHLNRPHPSLNLKVQLLLESFYFYTKSSTRIKLHY